jgi:hypothetical protein
VSVRRSDLVLGIGGGIALGAGLAVALVVGAISTFEAADDRDAARRNAIRDADRSTWIAPDLTKRYDVSIASWRGQAIRIPDCRILGKTGADSSADPSIAAIIEGHLALQTSDGRMVYVDSSHLLALQESRPIER